MVLVVEAFGVVVGGEEVVIGFDVVAGTADEMGVVVTLDVAIEADVG